MKRSTDRILTTFVGSLARPPDLLEMMYAREHGQPYNQEAYAGRVRSAVAAPEEARTCFWHLQVYDAPL